MMRKIRTEFLRRDPPLQHTEFLDVMRITNSVEETFFLFSKIEKEFNHGPHRGGPCRPGMIQAVAKTFRPRLLRERCDRCRDRGLMDPPNTPARALREEARKRRHHRVCPHLSGHPLVAPEGRCSRFARPWNSSASPDGASRCACPQPEGW